MSPKLPRSVNKQGSVAAGLEPIPDPDAVNVGLPPTLAQSPRSSPRLRLAKDDSVNGRETLPRARPRSGKSPRPGMSLVVHRQNVFHGKLRVTLRGGEPLVPEHLLNGAQVRAFLQQVGAESVPQGVRVNVR